MTQKYRNTYQRLIAKVGLEEARRRGLEWATAYRAKHKDRLNEAARERRKRRVVQMRLSQRKWQENNRDHLRKYAREYYKNNREKILAANLAYTRANLEKTHARQFVLREVKAGRLMRPTSCSLCSAVGVVEAHHHDYTKPLLVEWLCRKCHRGLHRLLESAMKSPTRGVTKGTQLIESGNAVGSVRVDNGEGDE